MEELTEELQNLISTNSYEELLERTHNRLSIELSAKGETDISVDHPDYTRRFYPIYADELQQAFKDKSANFDTKKWLVTCAYAAFVNLDAMLKNDGHSNLSASATEDYNSFEQYGIEGVQSHAEINPNSAIIGTNIVFFLKYLVPFIPKVRQVIDNPFLSFFLLLPHHSTSSTRQAIADNGDTSISISTDGDQLPSGLFPRIISLYALNEMISNRSKSEVNIKSQDYKHEIYLDSNLDNFLENLGLSVGTYNRKALTSCTDQLTECFFLSEHNKISRFPIPHEYIRPQRGCNNLQESVGRSFMMLAHEFYCYPFRQYHKEGKKHFVTMNLSFFNSIRPNKFHFDLDVIKNILTHNSSPYALDIYMLCAFILPSLKKKQTRIFTWLELHALSGYEIKDRKNYIKRFKEGLKIVQENFPPAQNTIATSKEVVFKYHRDSKR